MWTLYHTWLSPFSRRVRVVLAEKKLDFDLVLERTWERRREFLALNPTGEVPLLTDGGERTLADATAICEYIEECHPDPALMGRNLLERAEVRRLVAWFDVKFNQEVSDLLLGEKALKRFKGEGEPDSRRVRAGCANIRTHLDYIGWLADRRAWLAGESFSMADIAAAAHLSAVDYLGDVPWDDHLEAKEWYARVKSRPSFRPLLSDTVPNITPALHYADLDF